MLLLRAAKHLHTWQEVAVLWEGKSRTASSSFDWRKEEKSKDARATPKALGANNGAQRQKFCGAARTQGENMQQAAQRPTRTLN